MRVRALDANGDMQFGRSRGDFLIDSPAAVAQCVGTRIRLIKGEWFLNLDDGADFHGKILGTGTAGTRDVEMRRVILESPGVTGITEWGAALDPVTRAYSVQATITTEYGETTITETA